MTRVSWEIASKTTLPKFSDLEGKTKSDDDLIRKYRDIAQQSECDMAVEDIVNEAIVADEADQSVALILEYVPVPENIKVKIREEFDKILSLLYFIFELI